MKYRFSLIVATVGRHHELRLFLQSLTAQLFPSSRYEVVIVDQNDNDLITSLIGEFTNLLNIVVLRSSVKGLSYNRNVGIRTAAGEYLAFPDDDCEYYPDTLEMLDKQLQSAGEPDMLIGRVFNRTTGEHVFKKTPNASMHVNKWNFHTLVSSVALFLKNENIVFDEDFGIGGKYNSNEDGEIILHFLSLEKRVEYSPLVEINHPPYDSSNMSVEKLYRYGIGFGALCRKYVSIPILYLFLTVIGYQLAMCARELILFNREEFRRRREALRGRIRGWFAYTQAGH